MSLAKFKHVAAALEDLSVADFEAFAHQLWDHITSLDSEYIAVGDCIAILENLVDDIKQATHKEEGKELPAPSANKPTKRRTVIVETPRKGKRTRG